MAHAGVDLRRPDDNGPPLVLPRPSRGSPGPHAVRPFPMPPLPGPALERMCRVLRCLYRARGGACGTWLLYLHVRRRAWVPQLPPQWCGARGARVSLRFPPLQRPGRDLRLAGTCSAVPSLDARADADLLMLHLPPVDGLHLLWRPGPCWLDAVAFLTAAGRSGAVPLDDVIRDEPRPADLAWCQRLSVSAPA